MEIVWKQGWGLITKEQEETFYSNRNVLNLDFGDVYMGTYMPIIFDIHTYMTYVTAH